MFDPCSHWRHLDYCNLLSWNLARLKLYKLQCIQSSAACVVTNTCGLRFFSNIPVLHWPVFKTSTFTNSSTQGFYGIVIHISRLSRLPRFFLFWWDNFVEWASWLTVCITHKYLIPPTLVIHLENGQKSVILKVECKIIALLQFDFSF